MKKQNKIRQLCPSEPLALSHLSYRVNIKLLYTHVEEGCLLTRLPENKADCTFVIYGILGAATIPGLSRI